MTKGDEPGSTANRSLSPSIWLWVVSGAAVLVFGAFLAIAIVDSGSTTTSNPTATEDDPTTTSERQTRAQRRAAEAADQTTRTESSSTSSSTNTTITSSPSTTQSGSATPSTPPTTSQTSDPPDPPDAGLTAISAIGCSNTHGSVDGYTRVSNKDLLVNTAAGGVETWEWAQTSRPWERYDSFRPGDGYDGAWLQLCQSVRTGDPTQSDVQAILNQIWSRDPGIPVYISPLNFYETEDCGATGGNHIPQVGATLANQMAASSSDVFRGPDLGPLTVGLVDSDACHANTEGYTFLGTQLAAFFD